ncbi:MAG: ParA family protein [Alphaproteobacteria bacterium GM202ARS2]|nr:ParA family protein [Alphaproteobacteria bacterium GM202ARS2]
MPVISFANGKGGSGKTTSALLLGCEFAEEIDLTIIDADPRHPISRWASLADTPSRLTIIENDSEKTILDQIEEASSKTTWVIIDLEGIASRRVSYAMTQSDLVIIPAQEQQQDALAAIDIIQEIERDSRAMRRTIPYSVLFTRTRVVAKSRTARHIAEQFRSSEKIDVFDTELNERDAFAALYTTGGTLRDLNSNVVNNIDKAIENSYAFAAEVVRKVQAIENNRKSEVA